MHAFLHLMSTVVMTGVACAGYFQEFVPLATVTPGLAGGESVTYELELTGSGLFEIVGFGFRGLVSGISGSPSWASDLRLNVVAPSGQTFDVGGFSRPAGLEWAFSGIGSSEDGFYSDYFEGAFAYEPKADLWSLTLTNDRAPEEAGTMIWDFDFFFMKLYIPGPGVIATFFVFGIAAQRRR